MVPAKRGYELLEQLADLAGCEYLSDLTLPRFSAGVHRALEHTPAAVYPDDAWREAARYLLRRDIPGGGEAQRAVLLEVTGRQALDNPPRR